MVISNNLAVLPYSLNVLIAAAVIAGCGAALSGMFAVYRQLADGAPFAKRLSAASLCVLLAGLLVWAIVIPLHGIHSTGGWCAFGIGIALMLVTVSGVIFLAKGDQDSPKYRLLVKFLATISVICLILIVLAIIAIIIDTARGV